jgi:hypothetical protein
MTGRSKRRHATSAMSGAWHRLGASGARSLGPGLRELQAHPLRAGGVGLLFLALLWLVLTTSLPAALAPTNPDLALAFNARTPAALVAKAEALRSELLALVDGPGEPAPDAARGAGQKGSRRPAGSPQDLIAQLPEADVPPDSTGAIAEQRRVLRRSIGELARRVVAADPLNATGFRLLAEVTDDPEEERRLMQAAVMRSRRETAALFRLLNDSFLRKEHAATLDYADVLLRTRSELTNFVMAYLGPMAEDEDGRALLLARLAQAPKWRDAFFEALPRHVRMADTPLALMVALRNDGQPVPRLDSYLRFLVQRDLVDFAYNAWLRLLPAEQLEQIGFLTNPSFEDDPSGVPFDWQIARGRNAVLEFARLRELGGQRALHIAFGNGRVGFPVLSQVLVLPPGRYRLGGTLRGSIIGERGLRWRVACLSPPSKVLAETEMLLGQSQRWREFSLDVEVPESPSCRGQELRLYHDARTPSEELVSGEVWFDDLKLRRADD